MGKNTQIEFKPMTQIAKKRETKFKGSKVDFELKQRINKKIGNLGEQFILEYEKEKVRTYGLKKKQVQWVSKTLGDGLGYDILSYIIKGMNYLLK